MLCIDAENEGGGNGGALTGSGTLKVLRANKDLFPNAINFADLPLCDAANDLENTEQIMNDTQIKMQ